MSLSLLFCTNDFAWWICHLAGWHRAWVELRSWLETLGDEDRCRVGSLSFP